MVQGLQRYGFPRVLLPHPMGEKTDEGGVHKTRHSRAGGFVLGDDLRIVTLNTRFRG